LPDDGRVLFLRWWLDGANQLDASGEFSFFVKRKRRNENSPERLARCAVGASSAPAAHPSNPRESEMMSEMQVHVIARQMLEQHGAAAIARAAQMAVSAKARAIRTKPVSGGTSKAR
jgi:hypothetical protein